MKRFLAIFAMIAMIVSMFSGVAFAADKKVYVQVDNDILDYGKDFNTVTLSGKIFNSTSNALEKLDAELKVYKDSVDLANLVTTINAKDGSFSVLIQTDSSKTGVANYIIVGTNVTDEYDFEVDGEAAKAQDSFTIVYKTELAEPNTLEFNYPVTGQQVVQGVFVNEDADKDSDVITIAYKDAPISAIVTANFHNEKSFGFLFNGDLFTKVGDIGIYVNGVLAVSGRVKAGDLNVSLVNNEVVKALEDQKVTLKFSLADEYLNSAKDGLATDLQLRYSVKDSDDEFAKNNSNANVENVAITGLNFNKEQVEVTLECNDWDKGNYTMAVELYDSNNTTIVLEKSLDLRVIEPARYNLVTFNIDELKVGDNNINFTDIAVKEYKNSIATANNFLEVTYEGAGIEKTTQRFPGYDSSVTDSSFNIKPTKTGTVKFTVKVFGDEYANDDEANYTFATKEIEVKGWNIEVSPQTAMVDIETEFTVAITDENGNPVNNAVVKLDFGSTTETAVDGTTENIVGGIYTFDKEFTTVENVTVAAFKKDEVLAEVTLTDEIKVKGEEVYTVTSDIAVLVNGEEQEMYITVLNEEGNVVYPSFVREDVTLVDGKDDTQTGTNPTVTTRKDLDGDGVKEAIKVKVTATADQHTLILRATTDNGKKMGEIKLDVKKPQVVFTKGTKLTHNIDTELEFKVLDPRDNSVMNDTVELKAVYLADGSIDYATDANLALNDDGVWAAKVKISGVDYEKAEKDEKTVEVKLVIGDVELQTIEVVKPTLTATPNKIIIGSASNIVLTYTDAEGNILTEREVKLGEDVVGETNEEGQVVYAASSISSLSLEFKAETDVTNVYTTLKVKSTADTLAPVVTAPETVIGNKVTITIKDNVMVTAVYVNGKKVDMYFSRPEITYEADVKPGENTFFVQAADSKHNYVETNIVVTAQKAEPVKFTIGNETKYGTPALNNNVTMVPVRFAQDLGATVDWNNTTRTVTYYLGETKISMTLGSKTATVNGENVQVTVAPYLNKAGRTMVPLRMIAQELGFTVNWTSNSAPIVIE
ncbi:hypothetical protein IMX26_12210 [Clostridium sp. 'deep sea']|uniref:stalk domain-containing protein n=1 Tax=Clostridium sp. 'deep sea' TaxID=2779445 RepID=UPI00189674EE|nr:stalk domain-containing protein [Clostridium sp. 'deep sea']QOR34250.1 hypothetical protein IMX26_12210 [Clostridium sp. 'deep sea']